MNTWKQRIGIIIPAMLLGISIPLTLATKDLERVPVNQISILYGNCMVLQSYNNEIDPYECTLNSYRYADYAMLNRKDELAILADKVQELR